MKFVIGLLLLATACAAVPNPGQFIVGGQPAVKDQFPYMAALMMDGSSQFCGGSWIDDEDNVDATIVILTAAHCLYGSNMNRVSFAFGLLNKYDITDGYRIQASAAKNVVIHPEYNSRTLSNDVAVVIYDDQVLYDMLRGVGAEPIKLASTAYTPGDLATVSGWGTLSSGGNSSAELRYVSKPIIDFNDCKERTGYRNSDIDKTMMCCGEKDKDACQGDSGGPLVTTDLKTQIGVVSWGIGCGFARYPGVYADVWAARSWIISQNNK